MSNGSYTKTFCVKDRGRPCGPVLAAKFMKDKTVDGNKEVEILRSLQSSEYVVRIIETLHQSHQTILITEYLAGGNLFERLSDSQYELTENKCKMFMRQIMSGVSFIHSRNVIHLHLTPSNIIFHNKNSDEGLKIIDFGHSVQLGEGERSHRVSQLQGTPEYSAPELLRCEEVSKATDVWSLGVIIYMLVTGGVSPFYAGSRLRTMFRSLNANYDMNIQQIQKASQTAKNLIGSLLKRLPSTRLTVDECLNHQWLVNRKLVHQQTLEELETSFMKKWLARRRWYRAFNAFQAMRMMRKLSSTEYKSRPESQLNSAHKLHQRILESETVSSLPRDISEFKENYTKLNVVGSGGFGSVHLIQNRQTAQLAAAKVLRQPKQLVRAEASVLFKLIKSAFVVKFIALYESAHSESILVTEYLSGGDLVTRTASDTYDLTEEKCQIFIRQIARGLQFIHNNNIIHLDMKPFNVIFANPEDDNDLRIIDFGISQELKPDESSVPCGMCGTLEYMSPEVLNCSGASPAADIWGLGVIAYLLVSGGVSPFWATSRYKIMSNILHCDYNFHQPNFALLSSEATDFISKLLVSDPEERYSASDCLKHPWLSHIGLGYGLSEKEHWTTLETAWMRGILARRRWQRWYNAIIATHRIRKLSLS